MCGLLTLLHRLRAHDATDDPRDEAKKHRAVELGGEYSCLDMTATIKLEYLGV